MMRIAPTEHAASVTVKGGLPVSCLKVGGLTGVTDLLLQVARWGCPLLVVLARFIWIWPQNFGLNPQILYPPVIQLFAMENHHLQR